MTEGVTLTTKRGLARDHRVAKSAVDRWHDKGLVIYREGKVWLEETNRRLEFHGQGKFGQRAGSGRSQAATSREVSGHNAAPEVARDEAGAIDFEQPETLRSLDAFVELLMGGSYATIAEADAVKANALALTRLVEARRTAGQVIEVELAEQVLFEEARAARDAWLAWPARFGALMAAELGAVDSDRLIEVLSTYVHQQLEDLGEPDPSGLQPDKEDAQ